jgi:hypothetical protein
MTTVGTQWCRYTLLSVHLGGLSHLMVMNDVCHFFDIPCGFDVSRRLLRFEQPLCALFVARDCAFGSGGSVTGGVDICIGLGIF